MLMLMSKVGKSVNVVCEPATTMVNETCVKYSVHWSPRYATVTIAGFKRNKS